MCRPASFVVTKKAVYWSKKSDSHEEIIREYNLEALDKDPIRGSNLVRVEIIPPNETDFETPLDKWRFHTDQLVTPDWYVAESAEKECRVALEQWAKAKVFTTGSHNIEAGFSVYLCGNSTATLRGNSTATLCGNSTATLCGNSTATLCGNSTATLRDNSTATLRDNSTATLWGNSTATLCGNSTATLCGNSTATLRDNSTATLCGNSTATLRDNSTATLRGNSTATLRDNSTATLCGNSTATLRDNSTAKEIFGGVAKFFCKFSVKISGRYSVAVDMTGDKAKCYVGTDKPRIITGGK
jgi:phage gp45-like